MKIRSALIIAIWHTWFLSAACADTAGNQTPWHARLK